MSLPDSRRGISKSETNTKFVFQMFKTYSLLRSIEPKIFINSVDSFSNSFRAFSCSFSSSISINFNQYRLLHKGSHIFGKYKSTLFKIIFSFCHLNFDHLVLFRISRFEFILNTPSLLLLFLPGYNPF